MVGSRQLLLGLAGVESTLKPVSVAVGDIVKSSVNVILVSAVAEFELLIISCIVVLPTGVAPGVRAMLGSANDLISVGASCALAKLAVTAMATQISHSILIFNDFSI